MGRMERISSQSRSLTSTLGPKEKRLRRAAFFKKSRFGLWQARSGGGLRHRTADAVFDIAAADADVVELPVGKLRQLPDRVAVAPPRGELLGNRLEGGHR